MSKWYFARGGQQGGPVAEDELSRMVTAGELPGDSLVWADGMASWVAVGMLPQFAPPDAGGSVGLTEPAGAGAYAAANPAVPYVGSLGYEPQGGGPLSVSPRVIRLLQQTKPWVRFFSVLMFILAGLGVLASLIQFVTMMALGSRMGSRGGPIAMIGVIGPLVTLAFSTLYFFPALYLGRYASRIGSLSQSNRQNDFESAVEAQKSFWKFIGILAVVVISFYVLLLLFVLLVGFGSAVSR